MPTYDYKCNACGHQFEKFHSMSAAPIKKCPVCGKNTVQRLISGGAGLIFKGSGFYITDYRDAAYKEKAKADSGGDSKPAETGAAPAAAGTSAGGESSAPASKSDSAGKSESSAKSESSSKSESTAKAEPRPAPRSENKSGPSQSKPTRKKE